MAALQKAKLRGAAPKVRNKDRAPGYWIQLSRSRANRTDRVVVYRDVRAAVNYPQVSDVGSAAYRRLLDRKGSRNRRA